MSAKARRQQRKQEQARIAASLALVKAASSLNDPLSELESFKVFNKNGLNVSMSCQRVTELSEEEINWAIDLTRNNMKTLYEHSEWKWNERKKREEMTEETAWYLLAKNEDGKPVAFCHFRYDLDYDIEVVYCYDIQLEVEARRKGLGKFMMQILQLLAFRSKMKKVVLTVFKHNYSAVKFFVDVLKYEVDETSPSQFDDQDDCSYEILSKKIKTSVT